MDADKQAYCRACKSDYRAHKTDLKKHSTTETHEKKIQSFSDPAQAKLTSVMKITVKDEEKIRDLKSAAFVGCHTSIASADHRSDLLKFPIYKLFYNKYLYIHT